MKKIFLFLIFFSTNYFLYSQGRQADAYGETAIGVNSYSITIKAITDASIYDKQSIWFRGNSNTSTSTLKVYGAGSISYPEIEITNNGSSLNAGDIVANQWYQLKYSLALNKWQIQKSNLFTSISATSPLSIFGGSTSTISITSPLPIVNGGLNSTLSATSSTLLRGTGTSWTPSGFTIDNTFPAYQIPYPTSSNVLSSSNLFKYDGTSLVLGNQSSSVTIPFWVYKDYAGDQQIKISNINAGASSESSISVDNGSYSTKIRQLGTSFSSNGVLGAQVGVVDAQSSLALKSGAHIYWATGGTTTQKMILTAAGLLGIGNITPTEVLDVDGNIKYSGGIKVGGTLGTSGQILTTNGTTNSWTTLSTGVSSVSAISPLSSSGGSTPTISITAPLPIVNGGLNSSLTATSGTLTRGTGTSWEPSGFTISNTFGSGEIPYNTAANTIGSSSTFKFDGNTLLFGTATGDATTPISVLKSSSVDQLFRNTNSSSAIGATAGFDATNNSGNYFRFFINSSGNTTIGFGIPHMGTILNNAGSIGIATYTQPIIFSVDGASTQLMRLSSAGKVGIGIGATDASEKLHVSGNFRLEGAFMPGNSAGTSGQILTSAGTGASPVWSTLSTGVSSVSATSPLSSTGGSTPTISITSPLPLVNGGTNTSIAASAGSVIYSTASAYGMTTVGSPGQLLQSNSTSAPTFVSDIIPTTVTTESVTITTSAVTDPISLNIATHGDNSTTPYVTGININADQGLNVTGLNINASAINGGVANAGTFNSIASNALGYNNGIGAFSSNGKYNTSGTFEAIGGTNAIAASLWASGASTKNAALDILFGAIYLSGSAGTSGQVLTSAGSGSTPTWQTPSTSPSASVTVTDDNSTNSPYFPTWVTGAGTPALKMSSARVVFNPSNGRIGFNTASVTPTYDLSFGGTAARTLGVEQNTTSNTAGSNLTTYAGGATSGATDKDGGNYIINSGTSTGTGSSAIYFQTATSGTTGTSTNAVSTKMIIAGSGRVGIGTTGPGALLDVNQSSGNLALKITNSSVGTTGWFCYPNTNGSETDLRWGQKKADASTPDWFTFQSGGNLGIGTTSPSSKLHIVDANDPTTNGAAITVSLTNTVAVNSNTGANIVVSTTGSGSTNYGFQSVVSGASNSINYGGFFTSQNAATKNYGVYCQAQNATNNYPLVAIGGNVGIGTTTPTQLLQVAGATGTVSVTDAGVINQDGAKTHNHIKLSLADDGTYTLPKDGVIGQVSVITYENNGAASIDGAIDFRYVAYPTTGTGILTQIRSTDAVNAATSDTDTKLCAYMSGEDVIIKNRLGEAKNLLILFDYY